jgi:hypothetical protein
MDIEALTIGLRKAADDYDDTIRMIVSLAGEHGVDTNAVVGYTIDPQRAVSEHSLLIREAAEALTTMQAREATLMRERQWQPIKTAPKDGTPIQLAVRGWSPERPNANGHFVTVGRWSWSPDARLPHEKFPDDGGFLELNNDWGDGWGGNIGDLYWKPLSTFDEALGTSRLVER